MLNFSFQIGSKVNVDLKKIDFELICYHERILYLETKYLCGS